MPRDPLSIDCSPLRAPNATLRLSALPLDRPATAWPASIDSAVDADATMQPAMPDTAVADQFSGKEGVDWWYTDGCAGCHRPRGCPAFARVLALRAAAPAWARRRFNGCCTLAFKSCSCHLPAPKPKTFVADFGDAAFESALAEHAKVLQDTPSTPPRCKKVVSDRFPTPSSAGTFNAFRSVCFGPKAMPSLGRLPYEGLLAAPSGFTPVQNLGQGDCGWHSLAHALNLPTEQVRRLCVHRALRRLAAGSPMSPEMICRWSVQGAWLWEEDFCHLAELLQPELPGGILLFRQDTGCWRHFLAGAGETPFLRSCAALWYTPGPGHFLHLRPDPATAFPECPPTLRPCGPFAPNGKAGKFANLSSQASGGACGALPEPFLWRQQLRASSAAQCMMESGASGNVILLRLKPMHTVESYQIP